MGGAEAAVALGLLADTKLVIVGEPTNLRPCLGQKGVLQMSVTTDGASGHASMPWAGTNAIGRMGRILAAIKPLAGATPRQAATMTASPDVIEGGVAMNVIADSCTLQLDVRYALEDVQIGEHRVKRGQQLTLLLGSANRDPAAFEDPEHFDIHRQNTKEHLSLGFGAHYCLGAPLVRLEARIVLEELSARLPSLRLIPGQTLRFQPNTTFRGPLSLLVEWDT